MHTQSTDEGWTVDFLRDDTFSDPADPDGINCNCIHLRRSHQLNGLRGVTYLEEQVRGKIIVTSLVMPSKKEVVLKEDLRYFQEKEYEGPVAKKSALDYFRSLDERLIAEYGFPPTKEDAIQNHAGTCPLNAPVSNRADVIESRQDEEYTARIFYREIRRRSLVVVEMEILPRLPLEQERSLNDLLYFERRRFQRDEARGEEVRAQAAQFACDLKGRYGSI